MIKTERVLDGIERAKRCVRNLKKDGYRDIEIKTVAYTFQGLAHYKYHVTAVKDEVAK